MLANFAEVKLQMFAIDEPSSLVDSERGPCKDLQQFVWGIEKWIRNGGGGGHFMEVFCILRRVKKIYIEGLSQKITST